jgi:hypothetical protein
MAQPKHPLEEMRERTRDENSRTMDDNTFNELFNAGDFDLILMDGGMDLTPSQMAKMKAKGKQDSEEKLQKMAFDLATSPGYKEMMLTPIMSRLMGQMFQNNQQTESPTTNQESIQTNTPEPKSEKKETVPKPEPKRTTVTSTPIQNLEEGDSESDILNKMFNFMKDDYNWKNEKHKKDTIHKKKLVEDQIRRSDELLGLFTGKKTKVKGKKETKEGKKEEVKGKKETKEGKKEEVKKPTAERVPSKEPSKPSAVSEKPIGIRPSTIIAGIGGVGLASVAAKISANESGGSTTQANIVAGTNKKEHQIVKGNIDVTTGKEFDKPLNEMTIGEAVALGKRRGAHYKGKGGSALGKYQFIPSTLETTAKKLYGDGWQNRIFDDQAQEDINMTFLYGNAERLQKAGLPVSDASLYMMHFFGNPTQAGMVLNGSDNDSMKNILNYYYDSGKSKIDAAKQNPAVAALTVGEYKKKYLSKYDFKSVDISMENKVPISNKPEIPQKLKPESGKKPSGVSVSNVNTNVYNGGTSYNVVQAEQNNSPALIDKQYN